MTSQQVPDAPRELEWEVLSARFLRISPSVAKVWWQYNVNNRNLRAEHAESLRRDIEANEWKIDGMPIRFGTIEEGNPVLLDGQHRLKAIRDSGISTVSLVVTGIAVTAQDVMDTGAKRTFGDRLKMMGVPNSSDVAALTVKIYRWHNGGIRNHIRKPTNAELFEVFYSIGDPQQHILNAGRMRRKFGGQPSVYSLCSYLFHGIDGEDAADFFDKLCGDDPEVRMDNPIRLLHDKLLENKGSREPMSEITLLAHVLKAWNLYRAGEVRKQLSWTSGGKYAEALPTPK